MTVAVIGGGGFVGTSLAKCLTKSGVAHEILDYQFHDQIKSKFIDVSDLESFPDLAGTTTIVNLAAEHRDDVRPKTRYYDVNVIGAENVCNAARCAGVETIIFTSSVAIYGFAPPDTDESGNVAYFNEYGRTKHLAEQVYLKWQAEDPENRCLAIIRPTVIFGPGNRGNVFNLLNQIATNKFVMIGNGDNVKSMAYVENVAAFLVHCLSLEPGAHIYNYVDKPDLTMNQLTTIARRKIFNKGTTSVRLPVIVGLAIGYGLDLFSGLLRINLPISGIRVKKFVSTTKFASSVKKSGFEAPHSLIDGLEWTLQYEFIDDNSAKPTYETE